MGKKGGTQYHQRELTPEERALIAQQSAFLDGLKPTTDKLLNHGNKALEDVYNPDWKSLYGTTVRDLDQIRGEQYNLTQGKLPQSYLDNKMAYYNNLYENTMGQGLANLAKRGVVDSSRFNTTVNDMQKNINAQMSRDYTQDMGMQKGLLDQRYEFAKQPLALAEGVQKASLAPATTYLGLALNNGQAVNGALATQGQFNSGRGWLEEKGPGFWGGLGNAVGGIAGSMIACFAYDTVISLADRDKCIADVKVGDKVVTPNGDKKVLEVVEMGKQDLINVVINGGDLWTTATQTIVMDDKSLKRVDELEVGDMVRTIDGIGMVEYIEPLNIRENVFELVVEDDLFYAGGVLVEGLKESERECK